MRRALSAIAPSPDDKHSVEERAAQQAQLARSVEWMQEQLKHSVGQATATPWILDCDTTIKPLYGKQDGAVISYNPHKPGRPSHAIHTYMDRQSAPGARPRNWSLATGTARCMRVPDCWPCWRACRRRRGRGWFEAIVLSAARGRSALEAIEQPYLFKLRQSAGVKQLVQRQWARRDWCDIGQGWQACEDILRLSGWTRQRRVIVMRRARKIDLIVEATRSKRGRPHKDADKQQAELHFIDENEPVKSWEYAVLVCNTHYALENIGQLYRDRADCENGFDEIKNQWGWGGYSTHDIERCALSARAVALIYNWWSWYVRLAHPKARLEAITSRPKLLSAVGRMTRHAGQTKLLLTITHEAAAQIKALVRNVRAGLSHILASAPQLPKSQCWGALVRYIIPQILAFKPKPNLGLTALASG